MKYRGWPEAVILESALYYVAIMNWDMIKYSASDLTRQMRVIASIDESRLSRNFASVIAGIQQQSHWVTNLDELPSVSEINKSCS
jgi:hypothetical protein